MRIVCLSFWYYDYTIRLANSVSRHIDKLMLLLPSCIPREYLDGVIQNGNLELYCFTHPKRYIHKKLPISIKEILKKIKDFSPDLVHVQASNPLISLLLPLIKRRFPVVAELHDLRPHVGEESILYEIVLSFSRKYSDKIVVHGQRMKEELVREFGIDRNKVSSVILGEHEVKPFLKYYYDVNRVQEDNNTILFFGRIVKYKGLRYLIKTESIITKEIPDAKIVIAGNGDLRKAIGDDLIKMLEKKSFIVINRFIPYREGAKLFQRCSVVVLPYIEGSQSGVVFPAYAFRKPVVVTDVGSLPEIVDDGITGFVVPPRDSKALAEKIILLLEDKKLRRKMGEKAYRKLKTDLSWDKISKEIVEIYEETLREVTI